MIAGILMLGLVAWGILQISWVQNKIARSLIDNLKEKGGIEISFANIDIKYFDHLSLSELLLKDHQGDTLIYASKLDVDYELFSFSKENITLNRVQLNTPKVYLKIHEGQDSLNLSQVLARLLPPSSGNAQPIFIIDNMEITEGKFVYQNENLTKPTDRDFNENHMVFDHINGTITNFRQNKDTVELIGRGLSSTESCGLTINELTSSFLLTNKTMAFDQMLLITPNSRLSKKLVFDFNSFKDFSTFINDVVIFTDMEGSKIHTKDLAYFSNTLKQFNSQYHIIVGRGSGTIDHLIVEELVAKLGDNTRLSADGVIAGLPSVDSSEWHLKVKELSTNRLDIEEISNISELPEELDRLGSIEYSGRFDGQLLNFNLTGKVQSDLGSVETDLNLNLLVKTPTYSGKLLADSFNIGALVESSDIGRTSFAAEFSGSGLELNSMRSEVIGKIQFVELIGMPLNNISVDGYLAQNIFDGTASIHDPKLDMTFIGLFDMSNDALISKAYTQINHANLKALGLDENENALSLVGNFDLEARSMDDMTGTLILDSLVWYNDSVRLPLNEIRLNLIQSEFYNLVSMNSDILDVSVKGDYKLSEISQDIDNIRALLYPMNASDTFTVRKNRKITASMVVKQEHPIMAEYLSGLSVGALNARFEYLGEEGSIRLNGNSKQISVSSVNFDGFSFNLEKASAVAQSYYRASADQIRLQDSILFSQINLLGHIADTSVFFNMDGRESDAVNIHLDGFFTTKNKEPKVLFNSFVAMVNNEPWQLAASEAEILIGKDIEFRTFVFNHKDESIFIDAAFGEESYMTINPTNFLLSNINPFLVPFNTEVSGLANGSIEIPLSEDVVVEGNIIIEDFALNNDTLGTMNLSSEMSGRQLVKVTGSVNTFEIGGYIDFKDPQNALHLEAQSQKISIAAFQKYMDGLVSDLKGLATAKLEITGPINNPQLSGFTKFQSLEFTVDYLRTKYKGSALLDVTNDEFSIRFGYLEDRFGHRGAAKGSVKHKNFDNFYFDISLEDLKNFECLNTTRSDNELFYGTAFADGYMKVKGTLDDILLIIEAKSQAGTQIKIPLDYTESDSKLSYVQFVDLRDSQPVINEPVKTADGIQMDFNFEITNDAQVELIFDELLGDKIKGQGTGNLRMEVNTYGDFNMYGAIDIEKGDYLFTAFNIINKYFTVTPGSTISWDGDPYNATLDLTAVKREYPIPLTLVKGIVPPAEEPKYQSPVAVDCKLKLNGLLFNPSIAFDIDLPGQNDISSSIGSAFGTVYGRVKQDQEEIDRQVFSLLAFGSFLPPSFSTGTGSSFDGMSSVNNSLSDFISGQLSNWISQIDPDLQVGIDYQTATSRSSVDPRGSLDPELILSLRKKFFDRIEFYGSVDAASSAATNPYDLSLQYNFSGSNKNIQLFRKNVNDPTLGNLNTTTTGIGFFYSYQFDHFWFEKDRRRSTTTTDSTAN